MPYFSIYVYFFTNLLYFYVKYDIIIGDKNINFNTIVKGKGDFYDKIQIRTNFKFQFL